MDKHEWRKKEKVLYLPKTHPEVVVVPEQNFITIKGEGSPANAIFSDYIGALYTVAYTIKMQLKQRGIQPKGYRDFTVYPLEGVWDLNEQAKANFTGEINKNDFVYTLMIRQPDFIDEALYTEMLAIAKTKKQSNPLLEQVCFEKITEGECIQMLHLGAFDDEPASFARMEQFAREKEVRRLSKVHREIYLSDARKVMPEKLKTVLRFQVAPI
ncbi:hypothetical protein CBF23_010015 [Marinomonas agarivorans]|nr:hypothetical protein CBF23_010015 [Marinomonas agarivorans]